MNAYANHLASVNDVQDVIAVTDICDTQGNVLLAKGCAVGNDAAKTISSAELQMPLEITTRIENELDATVLFDRFQTFIANDKAATQLHDKHNFDDELKSFCEGLCDIPMLRQNLTVLSIVLPRAFDQAIFCAWFGSLVCKVSSNSIADPKNVFLAAICQDIGMLQLCPDIVKKKGQLSLSDWQQIQSHTGLGSSMVGAIEGIDASVARAILEHHEQLDGTGYPRGLFGSQLGNEGQILNLLGSINAIYSKHFKPFNRSLSGLIPIIQMNQQSHYGALADQMVALLQELPNNLVTDIPHHLAADVIAVTRAHCEYILHCADICAELTSAIGFRHNDLKLSSIQNAIIHISMSITTAGIVNEAYMLWLDQVAAGKLTHAYPEVEEAFLIMRELIYHISRLKRKLQKYLLKADSSNFVPTITDGLKRIEDTVLPPTPASLVDVWISRE